jgi:hypothetical protein
MATVGDPLMDLGGMLSYWVEADDDEFFQMFRRQPTTEPGMWTRAEFVERYCERMGFEITPEQWRFYEVFGLFRLAVIAQQIWYRYFHRQTTNEAYAVFGPAWATSRRGAGRWSRPTRTTRWGRGRSSCWSATARRPSAPTTTTCSPRQAGSRAASSAPGSPSAR